MQPTYYNTQQPMLARPPTFGNNNIVQNRAIASQPGSVIPRAAPTTIRKIYAQKTTKNKSFLDMYHYLKSIGIKNNEFMLTLIDPDLDGIDPHDPNLNTYYKQKVLRECLCNYW